MSIKNCNLAQRLRSSTTHQNPASNADRGAYITVFLTLTFPNEEAATRVVA